MNLLNWLFPILALVITALLLVKPLSLVFGMLRRASQQKKILETGEEAEATILEIQETGVFLNNHPQAHLRLQVQPKGGTAFEVETLQVIPLLQLAQFQPGARLKVKYDPADPHQVAIVESLGGMAATWMDAETARQDLTRIDEENKILLRTGVRAPARVLDYRTMGVNVNGPNPFVTLKLKVEPEGKPPFQAEARGVILETSIPKFQPGQAITVRYDPHDLTRVTIERSGT